MLHLDSIVRLGEVCNGQPNSHYALATLAGTWKAEEEERGAAAHSHRVPSLDNQEPRAVGVIGVVYHLAMAQESYISFQMCLVACSRSSNSLQQLCFPASILHSWGRDALANSSYFFLCHRWPITVLLALLKKKTLNGKKNCSVSYQRHSCITERKYI